MGQLRPASDTAKPANPLRYVGKEGYYSDDTGLMLLGARYYDPLIGRFITQDPKRDGLNWYKYAGNNPVNDLDPNGTMSAKRFLDMWNAYIGGKQKAPYHLPITELDVSKIPLNQFKTLYKDIKAGIPGSYNIDEYRNVEFPAKTDMFDFGAIGHVQLRLAGLLEIGKDGSWCFSGNVVGNHDDFDFQPGNFRSKFAEFLTTCGRSLEHIGAKPYRVSIDGYQPIMWSNLSREKIQGLSFGLGSIY